MRKNIKIPRILKIEKINGFNVICMFNNGESRLIDFKKIFKTWKISENDHEYPLLQLKEFKKVELVNQTLSWKNIEIKLFSETGKEEINPYEIDPITLFELSEEIKDEETFKFGSIIRRARKKAGMTQEQLAERSGTSRFYISRIENDKTDVELSTFRKIVEAGLGKHLKLAIE